jgi:hypothetical protein
VLVAEGANPGALHLEIFELPEAVLYCMRDVKLGAEDTNLVEGKVLQQGGSRRVCVKNP